MNPAALAAAMALFGIPGAAQARELYRVDVHLVLPPSPGQQAEPRAPLPPPVYVAMSSPTACQLYANQLAEQRRAENAAAVARLKARVAGTCTPLGARP